jgi:lysophospholipase L1-like esterase
VACVGDSLTQGRHLPGHKAWPGQLQALLGNHTKVVNLGIHELQMQQQHHGACNSIWRRGMGVIDQLNASRWDAITVMLGTNDMLSRRCGFIGAHHRSCWPDLMHGHHHVCSNASMSCPFVEDYVDFLRLAQGLATRVYAMLPPAIAVRSVSFDEPAVREQCAANNLSDVACRNAYPESACHHGVNFVMANSKLSGLVRAAAAIGVTGALDVVDVYSALGGCSNYYMKDLVHLSSDGHHLIAELMFKVLTQHVQAS